MRQDFVEAAGVTGYNSGRLTVTVIKPGLSKNNRYYSPDLLKQSTGIFENARMFADHQTDNEASARPEGSVKDWVASLTGVIAESDGTLKATAQVIDPAFKTKLENLKAAGLLNQMGVSIRCSGEATDGEMGGQHVKIIESLLSCRSVDFVTFAGAGGRVETMESVDPDILAARQESRKRIAAGVRTNIFESFVTGMEVTPQQACLMSECCKSFTPSPEERQAMFISTRIRESYQSDHDACAAQHDRAAAKYPDGSDLNVAHKAAAAAHRAASRAVGAASASDRKVSALQD